MNDQDHKNIKELIDAALGRLKTYAADELKTKKAGSMECSTATSFFSYIRALRDFASFDEENNKDLIDYIFKKFVEGSEFYEALIPIPVEPELQK